MGCFNMVGCVSKLPIYSNDEICAFIYTTSEKYDKLEQTTDMFSLYNDFYFPVCLPVFGKYDEYGGITDIIQDENVKLINDVFGMPVEQVIEMLIYNMNSLEYQKLQEILKIKTYLFVAYDHKSIYEYLCNDTEKYTNWNLDKSYEICREHAHKYDRAGFPKEDKNLPLYTSLFNQLWYSEGEHTINVYPGITEGLFMRWSLELNYYQILHMFRNNPDLIFTDGIKEQYLNMLNFWLHTRIRGYEFSPSRGGSQNMFDVDMKKYLQKQIEILDKHIEKYELDNEETY